MTTKPTPRARRSASITAAAASAIISAAATAQPCTWESVGGAEVGGIMASHDDGSGPALYLYGRFSSVAGVPANNVARWDGQTWSAVGEGLNPILGALASFDDGSGPALYAGGNIVLGNSCIARWDGQEWSNVGTGIAWGFERFGVLDMTVHDEGSGPALYAAGDFYDPIAGSGISKWDGQQWSPVGTGFQTVFAIEVFDDGSGPALYAATGQYFVMPVHFHRWDGNTWSPISGPTNGQVLDMQVYDDGSGPSLFVAGSFTTVSGIAARALARWDGSFWSAGASRFSGRVHTLTVIDDGRGDALFLGGSFTEINAIPTNNIARLTGSGFEPLGAGIEDGVFSVCEFDDGTGPGLYATGGSQAGGQPIPGIARWSCHTCYADCDGNTTLDVFDFLCFQDLFAAGDPQADCDNNTTLDIFDFLCFQDAFAIGCP